MSDLESTSETVRERKAQTDSGLVGLFARPGFMSLCLVVLTLAVFWTVKNDEFISLDDPMYITANPHIQDGLTWRGMVWAMGSGYADNWHPLTWISHMLDMSLFGNNPAGPHVVNLLFHAVNVVLLFLALSSLTGAHWRSALVAALFAWHPLHVESVAWVAERKDVLSTCFWMLTLLAYGRYVQTKKLMDYAVTLFCFVLGLMSKPMLVTLPCVLLLLDYWPLRRLDLPASKAALIKGINLVAEKIPFFVLSIACSVVTFVVQDKGGAVSSLQHYTLAERVQNAFVAYALYLGKLFWPENLAVFYPHPRQWPVVELVFAVLLLISLCGAAVFFARRWPFAFTGWFWFWGTLIPVIGLVQVGSQSMADRYSYVPFIGLFVVLVWGFGKMFARWRIPQTLVCVLAMGVLTACAAQTMAQLRYWRNSEILFRRALVVTGPSSVAYYGLGYYYSNAGRTDEAIDNYQLAAQVSPTVASIWLNLGNLWSEKKRYNEAVTNYETALRLEPDNVSAHSGLGDVLVELKRIPQAIEQYQAALQLDPEYARAHYGLGNALADSGKNDEAIRQYSEAVRLEKNYALAHYDLANLLAHAGRMEDAIPHYQLALQFKPEFAEAENNYGTVLFRLGRLDEAAEHFRAVLRYQPTHPSAHVNLANTLNALGKWNEAVAQYDEALRLTPDVAEARFGLSIALARLGRRDEALAQVKEVLRLQPDFPGAKQMLEKLGDSTAQ